MARASCRRRIEPTEGWEQLKLLFLWPERRHYDLIRPPLLSGMSVAERCRQIEASESRLRRDITSFKNYGMSSLLEPDEVERHPHFPLRPL